jgi:hypothetical protein
MAYTAADVTAIRNAIIEIASRGAAEVEINGRRVRYSDPTKLQTLLEMVEAEVNGETYGGVMPVIFEEVDD